MTAPTRPPVRYHGGKWRLAPWVISQLPPHECYVEPFAGALGVLLRKPPSRLEYVSDLDAEVVNFFDVLRGHLPELLRAIRRTPFSRAEFIHAHEPAGDPLERARRFYVRAMQGRAASRPGQVSSGWRMQVNTSGRAQGPAHEWSELRHLAAIRRRLHGVAFECGCALDLIRRLDAPSTLFYVDPPYLATTRNPRWGDKGYRHEFATEGDHCRLAGILHAARGMVALSGYPSPLYDELFTSSGWALRTRRQHTGANGIFRTECLWLNPAAAGAQHQAHLPLDSVPAGERA